MRKVVAIQNPAVSTTAPVDGQGADLECHSRSVGARHNRECSGQHNGGYSESEPREQRHALGGSWMYALGTLQCSARQHRVFDRK
jgi:hypothetical protein